MSLRPGRLVRSTYRARWLGVVLEVGRGPHGDPLALVQPVQTCWGGPQGRHIRARWIGVGHLEVLA